MDKIDQTFNPETGLLTNVYTSELDGKMYVDYKQDMEPYVEYATALRNDDAYTKQGIKNGWMHAMHISDLHILELRKIGVDIFTASAREIAAGVKKLNIEHACMVTNARI